MKPKLIEYFQLQNGDNNYIYSYSTKNNDYRNKTESGGVKNRISKKIKKIPNMKKNNSSTRFQTPLTVRDQSQFNYNCNSNIETISRISSQVYPTYKLSNGQKQVQVTKNLYNMREKPNGGVSIHIL